MATLFMVTLCLRGAVMEAPRHVQAGYAVPCCAMLCHAVDDSMSTAMCLTMPNARHSVWLMSTYLKPLNQTGQLFKVKGRMREKDDVWWS